MSRVSIIALKLDQVANVKGFHYNIKIRSSSKCQGVSIISLKLDQVANIKGFHYSLKFDQVATFNRA